MGSIKVPKEFLILQQKRSEHSLWGLKPIDAYKYLLWLLGKSDPNFQFPQDVSCLIYIPDDMRLPAQSSLVSAVDRLSHLADLLHATRPKGQVVGIEVLGQNAPNNYPDFVYCVSFGDHIEEAHSFFDLAFSDTSLRGARWTLGRHLYACLQLLVPAPKKRPRKSIDDYLLSDQGNKPKNCIMECEANGEADNPGERKQEPVLATI